MSIQKMRLQYGWSQQQLADASGLSARTIQRIEAGHAGSIESLKAIAAVFEVPFSTLTSETTIMDNVTISERIREQLAFHRVRRLRHWYLHLLIYVVANVMAAAINLLITPNRLWFIGLTLFWAIGLFVHAARVFIFDKYFAGDWERAQIEKLLQRPL